MIGMTGKNGPGRGAAYDEFARFYSHHWAKSDYYRQAAAILDSLLFSLIPRGSAVLDLCCGTGLMSLIARRRGFRVAGLDVSGEMLRYARELLPGSEFLQGDARCFSLPCMFHGVFSTFESLSHVMSAAGLLEVFRNVREALVEGGTFVFDLLTEEAYAGLWRGTSVIAHGGEECVLSGDYDPVSGTAWTDIAVSGPDNPRRVARTRITQKCHDLRRVAGALCAAGLSGPEVLCAAGDLGMTGTYGRGRVFVRAFKPLLLPGRVDGGQRGAR